MKLVFVTLLLLNISHAKGQQRTAEFRNILLRLVFPSFYNTYTKSCCKLYPGGCYFLLDNNGYTCDFLKDRVTKTQSDGWIEFTISNVQFNDQGLYRCVVMGTTIYLDYYVEVMESTGHYTQTTLKSSTKDHNSPTTVLEPTAPVLEQDYSHPPIDPPSYPWSSLLPAIVFVSAVICISTVAALVFCCVKPKSKQSNIKQAESLQIDVGPATSPIVYTTVDFFAYQKPSEIYENLRVPKMKEGPGAAEPVEYSTVAVH